MSTNNLAGSLLDRAKVSKLGKGIHDNVVVIKVDPEERKSKGTPIKKMLYITYATIDTETKKKKNEIELSWWALDPTSEFFFSNLREFCVQVQGLLSCYVPEEDAFAAMEKVFDDFEFTTVAEIEEYKWKKKDVDIVTSNIKKAFVKAFTPFVGIDSAPIRLKISTDSKGENAAYSSYGVFAEPMTQTESFLKFSDAELKNHSKAGNTVTGARPASSALHSL